MNRLIKFRAQRLGSKEWVYGDLIRHSKIDPFTYIAIGTGYKIDDPELGTAIKVFPDTEGQLTGLLDKNGKEIYEGDILEYVVDGKTADGTPWTDILKKAIRDVVGFKDGKFTGYVGDSKEYIVIGNIYENPELL